jgi:flagellar hook-associated protein 3 FlgL
MRVTDSMLFDNATRDGGAARARLEAAIGPASTGKRVVHPGDDPAASGLVTQADAAAARAGAIGTAAQRASDELSAADGALNDVTNALARAREIATQFSSAGYTAAQRAAAAAEVKSLHDQMVASLNTQVAGRYVMGGTLDGQPPFDAAGNYLGDGNPRQVEVAPGVLQDASVRADVAVKGAGGGVDSLATLDALQAALQANDQAGVAATLTPLATSTDQVSVARTQAGIDMNAFDAAVSASQSVATGAKTRSSHLTDADVIEANTQLAQAQLGLQASLTATSQGFKLSLLDYLK